MQAIPNLLTENREPKTESQTFSGLYVHVPFCQTKCPYCDFYSITSHEIIPFYLEALEKEAELCKDFFGAFDSLYLGGGTPSLLDGAHLGALVASLLRHFEFASDTEFTIEANPDDIAAEKLRVYRDLGVNRLSLGVQSFDEAELIFLQRRHTARQTLAAIELIRAAGCANLGLDLMYGLPGQSREAWRQTLETAVSLTPEHLSCYQLTITAGTAGETPAPVTQFSQRLARGEFALPDEEAQREFFLLTREFLEEHGYRQYEISNFARKKESQAGGLCHYCCQHNHKYWNHTPYLGLGPAAHSYEDGRRWWNYSSVTQYRAALQEGRTPLAGTETLTPEQLRLETLYLGFRTREGVSLEVIRQLPRGSRVLAELERSGLVRQAAGRLTATPEGLVVADRLALLFLN